MRSYRSSLVGMRVKALFVVSLTACQTHVSDRTYAPDLERHQKITRQVDSTTRAIQPTDTTSWKNGMIKIPGGTFTMGSEDARLPDAQPLHAVTVSGFWLDATPVTNREFAAFVAATGYLTVAERPLLAADFPGVPEDQLLPGSIVFLPPAHAVSLDDPSHWWKYTPGAYWREPEGPGSHIDQRMDHPVVHVCYEDAVAFCAWRGKRLPTEAEFEFAARGGSEQSQYAWGNELTPNAQWPANIWQGHFPHVNTQEDGFFGTSPVRAFAPNPYGLYDISGNVWQWCSDWYSPDYYAMLSRHGTTDPKGPDTSFDPYEPDVAKKVQRSGSFLCSDQYCIRYLVGSRGKGEVFSGSSNVGFRCAR